MLDLFLTLAIAAIVILYFAGWFSERRFPMWPAAIVIIGSLQTILKAPSESLTFRLHVLLIVAMVGLVLFRTLRPPLQR